MFGPKEVAGQPTGFNDDGNTRTRQVQEGWYRASYVLLAHGFVCRV